VPVPRSFDSRPRRLKRTLAYTTTISPPGQRSRRGIPMSDLLTLAASARIPETISGPASPARGTSPTSMFPAQARQAVGPRAQSCQARRATASVSSSRRKRSSLLDQGAHDGAPPSQTSPRHYRLRRTEETHLRWGHRCTTLNADTAIHDMLGEGATHPTPRPSKITLLALDRKAELMAVGPAHVRIAIILETCLLSE
jgi:hypothetical protein